MKISNRLKLVASFVSDNSNIIDVGCDHALLDIFLVKTKNNVKCVASDINEKPLESALINIKKYNLEDKIQIKKASGLETLTFDIDTIIISGLGGETIVDIIKKDTSKLSNINTIILSPHSNSYLVRKEITNLGYKIENEIFTYDQNKYYEIIKFVKGKEVYTDDELFFGPFILKEKNNFFKEYYKELLKKNKQILDTIPVEKQDIRNKLIKEIERLDRNIELVNKK